MGAVDRRLQSIALQWVAVTTFGVRAALSIRRLVSYCKKNDILKESVLRNAFSFYNNVYLTVPSRVPAATLAQIAKHFAVYFELSEYTLFSL